MRWIVRLFSLVLMLVLLGVGLIFLIPAEKVADLAAKEFSRATGRSLQIAGSVRPQVWPVLGVTAQDVTVSNADWSAEGPMLQAGRLEIGLDARALIAGTVRITSLIAVDPDIVLERGADGIGNWEFGKTGGAGAGEAAGGSGAGGVPGTGMPFTMERGEIRNGQLTYIDHASGSRTRVSSVDLRAAVPVFDGPADLSGSAMLNGQAVELTATVADFALFLTGRVVGTTLDLTAGSARVGFAGRAGTSPLAAEGQLDADLADLAAVSALAGIDRPALPKGLGAGSVAVSGAVTLTETGAAYLRGGKIVLDGAALTADLDLLPGEARPRLVAQIKAGALNLSGLAGGGGSGSGSEAGNGKAKGKAGGWPNDPLDASALRSLDAAITLAADSVDLGIAQLGATRAAVTLERGRAVLDLAQVAAYGGNTSGQIVVNGRDGLSMRADLTLADLDMQPLLTQFAGYDRLSGRGSLRFNLLASGPSIDALMKSLSGDGRLSLGKGELRGLDIVGMLRTLDPSHTGSGASTIFDSIAAGFSVQDGVLRNDDLAFAAPLLTATGAGKVGIGKRTLDYTLQPTAMADADGTGGVSVPLRISGNWDNPKFALDLEALAKEQFDEELQALEQQARDQAKALEAEARAKLEAKMQEELGITLDEGEALEDSKALEKAARRAAKKALQDQTDKALQDLLGGN